MTENEALKAKFHEAMVDLYYAAAKQINYRATRFLTMVNQNGGWDAAKKLLQSKQPSEISDGLTELWRAGRLDLSVEALVLKPDYSTLFSLEELNIARKRLSELNYIATWDKL